MYNDPELTGPDRELAEALGALRPAAVADDVAVRLAYQAGRARGRRTACTSIATSVAVVLAMCIGWMACPRTEVVEIVKTVPEPTFEIDRASLMAIDPGSSPEPQPLSEYAYWRTRQAVLEEGLDSLPVYSFGSDEPVMSVFAWRGKEGNPL